jgi:chromosome segregation ATPase
MPEETGFPRNMYHEDYGVISVESEATMELALSRGWKRVPPALNTIPKLKAKITEVEAELKELKENLAAKIHETEIAMKAEEILGKMRVETAAKEAEAQKVAEEQAAKEAAEAEGKAEAEAKAAAEAEVAAKEKELAEAVLTTGNQVAVKSGEPPPLPKVAVAEFGEKGTKKK